MLSDRNRAAKAAILSALLILACLYSHALGQKELTAGDYVKDPGLYENASLFVKAWGWVLQPGDGHFDAFIDGEEFRIYGIVSGLSSGDDISGEFVFHGNRTLDIVQLHVHKYRGIKLIISLLAALAALALLWKTYKLNIKKFVLEERKCRT